jgi:hypothetical protein
VGSGIRLKVAKDSGEDSEPLTTGELAAFTEYIWVIMMLKRWRILYDSLTFNPFSLLSFFNFATRL